MLINWRSPGRWDSPGCHSHRLPITKLLDARVLYYGTVLNSTTCNGRIFFFFSIDFSTVYYSKFFSPLRLLANQSWKAFWKCRNCTDTTERSPFCERIRLGENRNGNCWIRQKAVVIVKTWKKSWMRNVEWGEGKRKFYFDSSSKMKILRLATWVVAARKKNDTVSLSRRVAWSFYL